MDIKIFTVIVILLLGLNIVFIWKDDSKVSSSSNSNTKTIKPATFNIGEIPTEKFKASSLCNDKVLYPINSLDVDYGNKMKDCPCNQFLASP